MRTQEQIKESAVVKRRIIALGKKKVLRKLSCEEIGKQVNCSKTYVYQVLIKAGVRQKGK